jgi:hypothetical protein
VNAGPGEFGLKVEPAHPGQPNVEHKTGGSIWKPSLQKIGARSEHLNAQADRTQQAFERLTQGRVVVNHEDERLLSGQLLHAPPTDPPACHESGIKPRPVLPRSCGQIHVACAAPREPPDIFTTIVFIGEPEMARWHQARRNGGCGPAPSRWPCGRVDCRRRSKLSYRLSDLFRYGALTYVQ